MLSSIEVIGAFINSTLGEIAWVPIPLQKKSVQKKALFHTWVSPSLLHCSVGTFSKTPSFVGRLKQLRFSVGNSETKRFSVSIIKTITSFSVWVTL